MFDLLALALAIFCLLIILQFRAALAVTFNKLSAQILDTGPAEEIADLLPLMDEELRALGFEGPIQVAFDVFEGDQVFKSIVSVYKNSQEHTLLWCHCSVTPATANNLLMYWTTLLEDKRVVVSQAFETYYELMATDLMPANTITGETLSEQFVQHKAYLQSFDVSANQAATEDQNILYQASEVRNQSLELLVASGKVRSNSQGMCKPSFLMGVKLLWSFITRSKESPKSGEIPASRLVLLAEQQKVFREREPRKSVQLGIFTISLLFSIAIGAYFWDIQFAIILMIVIIFHELGHYLAMRVFGFKNVHMLPLPLVGGVTMGFDTEPNAWRQAWMSLMGPLPGILIGWGIVIWFVNTDPVGLSQGWIYMTVLCLLLINYLNVLPVLPLDGGHVVDSLIPPRWLKVKGLLIILVCTMGAAIAFYFEFYILVVLALLQLLAVPNQFKISQMVKDLYQEQSVQNETKRPQQLQLIFEKLETTEGTSQAANKTINKAESVLKVLTTKPMSSWQRAVICAVYSALLIVPIGVLIFGFSGYVVDNDVDWEAREINQQAKRVEFKQQASSKTYNQLIQDLSLYYHPDGIVTAVSEQTIQAKEEQLNIVLPDEIKAFYRVTDGLNALGIAPISQLNIAKNTSRKMLSYYEIEGSINAFLISDHEDKDAEETILIDDVLEWVSLSDPKMNSELILIELSDKVKKNPRVLFLWEEAGIYPSFKAWLESQWVSIQESDYYDQQLLRATENEFVELMPMNNKQLIDTYQKANESSDSMQWLINLILSIPEVAALPDGAGQSEIVATENRFKR